MAWSARQTYVAKLALVALVYVATARAGLALAFENSSVTAIWAPTGIALAALVLGGARLWPGIAIGALLANAWTGLPVAILLAITAGNTLEAVVGAYLLRAVRFRPALERVRDVLALVVLAAALSTLVSAGVGIGALRLGGELDSGDVGGALRTWWLGDMGGDLLVAPLLLVLAQLRPASLRLPRGRALEAVTLAVVTVALSALVFSDSAPLAYVVLPLVIWAALRFGQVGAVAVSAVIAGIAVAATAAGAGPFAHGTPDVNLLVAQTFVATGAVIGLLLAAVTAERSRAQAALLEAGAVLEAKVAERTAAIGRIQTRLVEAHEIARIGSWEWDVPSDTVSWSEQLYRIYGVDPAGHEATLGGYLERVHRDDRERVAAEVAAALAEGGAFRFDERIVRPDGTVRTLASRGQVHRDAAGQPLRMVGICRDVTESRRADLALRASEERARLIVDAASDAFIATDERDVIIDYNAQAQALLGWTREQALGRRLGELVVPHRNRARHRAALERYVAGGDAPRAERLQREALHRDGHEIAVELTIAPLPAEDGRTLITFMHDISERLRAERYLATEHAVSRVLLEARTLEEARPRVLEAFGAGMGWAAGGWWEVDDGGAAIRCAQYWQAPATTGADSFEQATMSTSLRLGEGLPGRVWESGEAQLLPAIGADANCPRRDDAAQAGLRAGLAAPLRSRGQTVAVIEFYAAAGLHLGDGLGEMMSRLCERVAQFVERTAAEADLREAEERFHRAFADAGTGMALIGVGGDDDGRFLEVNDALCAFLRSERDDLLGMKIADITHPDDVADARDRIRRLVAGEIETVHSEGRLIGAGGDVVWISFSTSVVRDAEGEPLYRISQLQDVTERRRFEGQLQHLADHDPITGLFNRRRFDEELERELASAQRYRTGGAVLALDLDNFKYINDTLGHSAGDEMIVCVGELLRSRLRATDIVARLGGDEFAVILPHVDERQARRVAGDLLGAIRSEAIVSTAKGSRRTTASIGIALFPPDSHGPASEELLVEADIAMYDAKEAGRDQACLYDADSSRQLSLQARMTWAEEIRAALAEDRFTLYAQPIVPLQGGSARHELLVRMVSRDGDIVPPGAFLPVAERFDLVQDIDRWVVNRAIELLGEHERAGNDVCFEVNLSAKSLGQTALPAQIARQLAAHNVDPRRLIFEVTETAAIVNLDRARQFATRLGELGCGFALDDFGAGFASFYYLKHLPFDYLKIDGEFVTSLTESTTNQLVVQSLVTIARGLGKQTIAEYVGDDATVQLLREYGVDFAQGFHLGRPCPVAQIVPARCGEGITGG